ncbi:MAG: HesA/MoeB/ThiF family protein [Acidobacteriota bacterium]
MIRYKLRMTGRQYAALSQHLLANDGCESVALALCGVGERNENGIIERVVMIREVIPVPIDQCMVRTADCVKWSTEILNGLLSRIDKENAILLKLHSHRSETDAFSETDDISDNELVDSVSGYLQRDFCCISAIMTESRRIKARVLQVDGKAIPVESVLIVGDDIHFWLYQDMNGNQGLGQLSKRTTQTLGRHTTQILSRLRIGIVGTSGTGSPTVEMLNRLGVGYLVLVDGDIINHLNVGRIYNSTVWDADEGRYKVHILKQKMQQNGLPTIVEAFPKDLYHASVIRALAQCDIIFGCMDSVDGRHLLNRLCVYYSIPYFDIGIGLDADGQGGVELVSGTVHYIQADGSSLMSRGVYNPEMLLASITQRQNPEFYEDQRQRGYLRGSNEDRPAVISVNTMMASIAVNDFLSRIHPIRYSDNKDVAQISLNWSGMYIQTFSANDFSTDRLFFRDVGRGDVHPLLLEYNLEGD